MHEYTAFTVNGIIPAKGRAGFQVHLWVNCTCGERIERIVDLPPAGDTETPLELVQDALYSLLEAL